VSTELRIFEKFSLALFILRYKDDLLMICFPKMLTHVTPMWLSANKIFSLFLFDFIVKKRHENRIILAMKIMQDNDLYYEKFASGGAGGFKTPPGPPVLLPSAFGGRVACAPSARTRSAPSALPVYLWGIFKSSSPMTKS